jgi:hypothetical protein
MDLVALLIFVLVLGLVYWIITLIPLPAPFRTIALVVLGIIAILWLLGGITGYHPFVIRR